MGRPTKLTAATRRRICELLRKGVPRERAARLAGVHPATFFRWMADGERDEAEGVTSIYREFREAVCMAEDQLVERAVSAVTDLLGEDVDEKVRLNAAKFILSHRYASEFSTRQEVRTTGPDGGPVQVRAEVAVRPVFTDEQLAAMSPEQLAAAIGALGG